MRSTPGKPGRDFIARREHILDGHRGPGGLRAVLASLHKATHTGADSIILDLLADDVSRKDDILARRPNHPQPYSRNVHFWLDPTCFSCTETFQGI
jgi:hypothetical protein